MSVCLVIETWINNVKNEKLTCIYSFSLIWEHEKR